MNFSLFRRMVAHFLVWSYVSVFILGLSSCGGSGGGDGDDDGGPAPRTFNGLVITLYTSGVELTFIRAEGDASTGAETGAVTMKINPGATSTVDSSGATLPLEPSTAISGARYTYVRTGPEAGNITITGFGSGSFGTDGNFFFLPTTNTSNYFKGPDTPFTRNYAMLFGTNGVSISGVDVNDSGEDLTIFWNNAIIRVFGGGLVTNGWSLESSAAVNLPKLYPTELSRQELVIIPANSVENGISYSFLTSTFTRFSDAKGDFIEEGVGNGRILGQTALTIINYNYQPESASTNRAIVRIFNPTGPAFIYNMTFLDLEKGNYVREDGSVGTFEFPFLE